MKLRTGTWIAIGMLAAFAIAGCNGAWKTWFEYDEDGSVRAEVKGAGERGTYNENKGLNLSLGGENTLPALVIAGGLAFCIAIAYPLQRTVRLWAERRQSDRYRRMRQERLREEAVLRGGPATGGMHQHDSLGEHAAAGHV